MDLIGKNFGRWIVIAHAPDQIDKGRGAASRFWLCRCSCEAQTERVVCERSLTRGTSISCGCSRTGKPSKKLIDLTGKQFERWTVLYRTKTDDYDNIYWMCKCNCGTQREVSGKTLINGKSRSCGCLKSEEASKRLKGKPSGSVQDLTGQRFGKWLVLGLAERLYTEYGLRIMWNCKCDCGTERSVDAATLKGKDSQSCGCSPYFNDLTGNVYGRLTVIEDAGRSKEGHVLWFCKCACGGTKTVPGVELVRGHVGSCGCASEQGIIVRPEYVRRKKADDIQRQYREDIKFNLNRRMSSMIRLALRRKNTEKGGRWTEIVGYTVDELRIRLESTMPEGYTWADYLVGKLHIDHIVPLAVHNYEHATDIDFLRAWALSNLRLLPGDDNMKKNDRIDEPFQPSLLLRTS